MEAITNYVMGILLVLTIVLGFTTYIYHGNANRLQQEVAEVSIKLQESEANVTLANNSCEISQSITKDVADVIDQQQTVMTKALETLVTVPSLEGHSNEKYADDASLSPELMRLLDTTYCSAAKTDPTCTTSRSAKDVPSGKSINK